MYLFKMYVRKRACSIHHLRQSIYYVMYKIQTDKDAGLNWPLIKL